MLDSFYFVFYIIVMIYISLLEFRMFTFILYSTFSMLQISD